MSKHLISSWIFTNIKYYCKGKIDVHYQTYYQKIIYILKDFREQQNFDCCPNRRRIWSKSMYILSSLSCKNHQLIVNLLVTVLMGSEQEKSGVFLLFLLEAVQTYSPWCHHVQATLVSPWHINQLFDANQVVTMWKQYFNFWFRSGKAGVTTHAHTHKKQSLVCFA